MTNSRACRGVRQIWATDRVGTTVGVNTAPEAVEASADGATRSGFFVRRNRMLFGVHGIVPCALFLCEV